MSLGADETQVDAWLREKGIEHTIRELEYHPILRPDCGGDLLDLFKRPLSLYASTHVVRALFARNLDRSQKQEAVQLLLGFIKRNPERWGSLDLLVVNELYDNVTANQVHDIGELVFDKTFGPLRFGFTRILGKIGNADAISYLMRAAKDPGIASIALSCLARLRVEGTLELCEEILTRSDLDAKSRQVIEESRAKLRRQLAMDAYAAPHVLKDPVPSGLPEWSVNLDGAELGKALRTIQRCVSGGFGKKEVLEVRARVDDLDPGEKVRFKFVIQHNEKESSLFLELSSDDPDALELFVFATQKLIDEVSESWNVSLP